ncbi:MAG: prolipoprotein diacylglyceryl transferase, partial [Candidatus Omnitrophota bacterium]
LDVLNIFDLVIPYVALAQAIGRIGCLLNGCCFGLENSCFGIYFASHQAVLIPTQLYSSLALLGIYVILRLIQIRAHQKGSIFYLYLLLYCLWRFFIEFWRGDSRIFMFNLSIFQIFSIVLFILSVIMLVRIKRRS